MSNASVWNWNDAPYELRGNVVVQSIEHPAGALYRGALKAGDEIPEHDHRVDVWLYVLGGQVEMTSEGRTHRLTAGAVIRTPARARHSLRCLADAVVLEIWFGPPANMVVALH